MVGRRRVLAGLAWLVVLAVSWVLYRHEDSLQHFAWHLGYGASAGLVVAAAVTGLRGRHPGPAHAWALAGYLYMAIPDVLWLVPTAWGAAPYPHEPWMDVFLGHYSLDLWPLATPLLVPAVLVAVGLYVWIHRRDRSGSTAEA